MEAVMEQILHVTPSVSANVAKTIDGKYWPKLFTINALDYSVPNMVLYLSPLAKQSRGLSGENYQ